MLGDEVGLIGLGDKEGCEEGGEPGGDRIPAPGDSSNSDLELLCAAALSSRVGDLEGDLIWESISGSRDLPRRLGV